MEDLINLFILDFLLGVNNITEEERDKKLESLKNGLYDDFQVTIEFPSDLDEMRFNCLEDYLEHIKKISTILH